MTTIVKHILNLNFIGVEKMTNINEHQETVNYDAETIALHGGHEVDSSTFSRAVPIYQTSAFVFESTDYAQKLFDEEVTGNVYTRLGNPTTRVFEKRMALLEGGTDAIATASGTSAISTTILNIIAKDDEIVASSNLYVGTYSFFTHSLPQFGVKVNLVDPREPEQFRRAITQKLRLYILR